MICSKQLTINRVLNVHAQKLAKAGLTACRDGIEIYFDVLSNYYA